MVEQAPVLEEERLTMQQLIDARIDQRLSTLETRLIMREEFERRLADAETKADAMITRLVAERAAQIEERLNQKVSEFTRTVNLLTERLEHWLEAADQKIEARTGEVTLLRSDLTRAEEIVAAIQERQGRHAGRLNALHATIHGDPKVRDGQPSLYKTVQKLADEMERKNNLASQEIQETARLVATHEKYIADQKLMRERRKEMVIASVNWALKTSTGRVVVVSVLVAAFYVLAPDLAALLMALLNP